MDVFKDFITAIEDPEKRQRVTDILTFIHTTYPQLGMRIAWGCPILPTTAPSSLPSALPARTSPSRRSQSPSACLKRTSKKLATPPAK